MKTEIKTGLIMEGGAMRGMFTCGVIDVLMQNDITVDGAIGISAGAVFGCNFKSRQVGRAIRYNKKYGSDPRYSSIRSLLRTGNLYGVDFCYRELPDELDIFDRKTYRRNPYIDIRRRGLYLRGCLFFVPVSRKRALIFQVTKMS